MIPFYILKSDVGSRFRVQGLKVKMKLIPVTLKLLAWIGFPLTNLVKLGICDFYLKFLLLKPDH